MRTGALLALITVLTMLGMAPVRAQDGGPAGIRPAEKAVEHDPVAYRKMVMSAYASEPTNPYVVAQRGAYYFAVGNEYLAQQDLRAAIKLLGQPNPQAAYIWADLARVLAARGDMRGALGAWDDAVRLDPQTTEYIVARGGVKLRLADQIGAQDDFHLALNQAGEDAGMLNLIGDAVEAAGLHERARTYYTRANTVQPDPQTHYNMARAYFGAADYEAARRELDLALDAEPEKAEWLNFAGELAHAAGDDTHALEQYRAAISHGPSLANQLDLAQLLSATGDATAEDAWNALVQDYANHADVWVARARHYMQHGQYDAAIADCRQAQALVPEDADAEECWAECLADQGDIESAEMHYRRAIDLDPSPALYVELITLVQGQPGHGQDVDALWTELLTAFPEHPEALFANASRLMDAGNYSAALAVYRHGAEVSPGDYRFPRGIGDCQAKLGKMEAAVQSYADALDLYYEPALVADVARAYVDMGQDAQADAVWRSFESLHPADADLVLAHGDVAWEQQDYSVALSAYRDGEQQAPDDPVFCYKAGLCYIQLGQPELAVRELADALKLREDPAYYGALARAYNLTGDQDQAGRTYSKGLTRFPDDAQLNKDYALFVQQSGVGGALGQLEHAADVGSDASMYLQAAQQALSEGDSGRAEANYRGALAADPVNVDAATGLALLLAGQGRRDELLTMMAQAKAAMPMQGFGNVADKLGAWWIDSGDYQTGTKFFEDLLKQAGPHPTLYTALALLYWLDGSGGTALDVIGEALSEGHQSTYYLYYLQARITYEVQGAAAARDYAEALLKRPGLDVDGVLLAVFVYRDLGEDELREQAADLGLTRFPDSPAIYQQLAQAYYDGGKTDSAIALLEDTGYQAAWSGGRDRLLGYCYLDAGNYVKAAGFLAEAVKRDPNNAQLWALLGEARYFIGSYTEARQALTTALALDDQLPAASLWLGFVLIEQREYSGARTALNGVVASPRAVARDLAWAALGQGRVAGLSGNRTSAKQLFDTAEGYGLTSALFVSELERARRESGL